MDIKEFAKKKGAQFTMMQKISVVGCSTLLSLLSIVVDDVLIWCLVVVVRDDSKASYFAERRGGAPCLFVPEERDKAKASKIPHPWESRQGGSRGIKKIQ